SGDARYHFAGNKVFLDRRVCLISRDTAQSHRIFIDELGSQSEYLVFRQTFSNTTWSAHSFNDVLSRYLLAFIFKFLLSYAVLDVIIKNPVYHRDGFLEILRIHRKVDEPGSVFESSVS